ncbi:ABC-three component system protein [Photobacterium leiognathi]|uniref:ABC-three component system protein n=2 Tax=Photobacterium leiognathi TaxID=553611 RepID=UPI00298114FC|nr:ABC-three component system protein [Photobacterium leiognathi]
MSVTPFDASQSLLGYIYQVRYSLYLSLIKMREVNDPDDHYLSIETLDDIAFDDNGTPTELLQTKYHSKPGNLTDSSPDIWKTLRIWIEASNNKTINLEQCDLFLITTETSANKSVASMLGITNRETNNAIAKLTEVAKKSTNKNNKIAYNLFISLSSDEKELLINNIYIINRSESLLETRNKIKSNLRGYADNSHIDSFTERLEGIWFKAVIDSLSTENNKIQLSYLVDEINHLRESFLPDNLPSDYEFLECDSNYDDLNFIKQISLFNGSKRIIQQAKLNYYRACEQRIRWSNDSLLKPGELNKYDRRLIEQWEHKIGIIESHPDFINASEKDMIIYALDIYNHCHDFRNGSLPIRKNFIPSYVEHGSYQKLANELTIGWHPDYEDLMNIEDEKNIA